jgi:hypothetical protein
MTRAARSQAGAVVAAAALVLVLAAAVLAGRPAKPAPGPLVPRPAPAAPTAVVPAPSPPADAASWRANASPPDQVAPGVLARVASRRPERPRAMAPPACGPDSACGSAATGPVPCAAAGTGGRERAGRADPCDNAGDGIESVEIDWNAPARP